MRMLWILTGLCLFTSCNWLSSKEERTQKLVEQQMREIDWNEIDQYPLFSNCDETASKTAQRNCFQSSLLAHLSRRLKEFEFTLEGAVDDTLYIEFLIDGNGKITLLEMDRNSRVSDQIPEFENLLVQSLTNVPKVAPALKRGIPVSAKFRLPIVLKTE